MKPEQLKLAVAIFEEAADLTTTACAQRLDERCGTDAGLRALMRRCARLRRAPLMTR